MAKYILNPGALMSKCEGDTILEALVDAEVFQIDKKEDGDFYISELCDKYYGANLTREQLIDLGNELIALAKT